MFTADCAHYDPQGGEHQSARVGRRATAENNR